MPQPFNNFTGNPSQRNENPFSELTDSLIFPGSLPFQQSFQPGWPNPQAWQANGQTSFNMGDFYQGQLTGSNGYFPEQQDYVEIDEGDDFYTNGEEDTATVQGANGTSIKAATTGEHTPSVQQDQARHTPSQLNKAMLKPQLSDRQQNKVQNSPVTNTEERLAMLRAKLVASKKNNGGTTPTPEPKVNKQAASGQIPKMNDGAAIIISSGVGSLALGTTNQSSLGTVPASTTSTLEKEGKAPLKSEVLSAKQSASGTEIDALFDEVRASEDAKTIQKPLDQKQEVTAESKVHLINGQASKDSTQSGKVAASPISKADRPINSYRPTPNISKSSSETSEQGEIREEPKKQTRIESKPAALGQIKNPREKPKSTPEGKPVQSISKPTLIKQPPAKIDTTVTKEGKPKSGQASAKIKSPVSARAVASSRPREDREPPPSFDFRDSIRDRPFEHPRPISDRRPEYERDRPTDAYQHYDGSRYDEIPRHRQSHRIEQTEQSANEPKRDLQLARPNSRESLLQPQPAEDSLMPKAQAVEPFDDKQEWLEMTGYFDKNYREKALVRHRKLVELDKQRAELEREGQIEHEERLQISRAISIRPRESIEGAIALRASVARQVSTSSAMPPPPVPMKDAGEDLGIQIKDLATRDTGTAAAAKRNEDDLRASRQPQDSPVTLAPSVKRQHSPDTYDSPTGRPLEKVTRTDSRDYSFDKKAQPSPIAAKAAPPALENRITVDNSTYRRNYQARSRSRSRRRSLTPPFRRGSGSEIQAARYPSGIRNDFSSGRQRGGDISPVGRDRGPAHDDDLDGDTRGRYNPYPYDYDNRSNSGYDSYSTNNHRGGYNSQWTGPNYRGRGRGKGRANYNSNRGGIHKPNDRSGSE
ncbi:hypothetical protein MMC14_003302 [Varicellaria rhodocarpa]|nr:hypothetical protein [Varicellaria rhodocarpa]